MALQRTTKAVVRPGEQSGWVAKCFEVAVVTQAATLDELTANLREAVELALEGEDLATLGLGPGPAIVLTIELPFQMPKIRRLSGAAVVGFFEGRVRQRGTHVKVPGLVNRER